LWEIHSAGSERGDEHKRKSRKTRPYPPQLCQIFLEESPKLLQKLQQAIACTDAEAVMHAAHSLKGELGYLGAAGASQAARELENMGHRKNLSHAPEVFVVLQREIASLNLALKEPAGVVQ
jgi:HPt (histidine-containing phosphotransfer) domain-containing protein